MDFNEQSERQDFLELKKRFREEFKQCWSLWHKEAKTKSMPEPVIKPVDESAAAAAITPIKRPAAESEQKDDKDKDEDDDEDKDDKGKKEKQEKHRKLMKR